MAAELIKLAPVPGAQAPDLADFERELFELIPADLITEVVTEEGAFAPGRHRRRSSTASRSSARDTS